MSRLNCIRACLPARCRRTFADMLETVPYAAGVNNHEGSLGTADQKLMDDLMPLLHERNLFFIDSRTTVATVAETAAHAAGVAAARRNVFLDDEQSASGDSQTVRAGASATREKKARRWRSAIRIPRRWRFSTKCCRRRSGRACGWCSRRTWRIEWVAQPLAAVRFSRMRVRRVECRHVNLGPLQMKPA